MIWNKIPSIIKIPTERLCFTYTSGNKCITVIDSKKEPLNANNSLRLFFFFGLINNAIA
jgi:hypothetical protein